MKQKNRLIEIDAAKGFAIFLVVLGHLASPNVTPLLVGNDFYFELKKIIYSFHMPFFMFLSGLVFFYTFKPMNSFRSFISFVLKKAYRLLLPFIMMGILVLVGKYGVSTFLHVENYREIALYDSISNLFISPMESNVRSLWFIYVLFEFYIVFPLLMTFVKDRLYLLLLLGLILFFLPVSHLFAAKQFVLNFLFFAIGMIYMKHYKRFNNIIKLFGKFFLLCFLIFFYFRDYMSASAALLVFGLLSIPAVFYIFQFTSIKTNKLLLILGKYTFMIYLFNTLFIGLCIGILLKFIVIYGNNFYYFIIPLVIIGIIGPIILKKFILNKFQWLKKLSD